MFIFIFIYYFIFLTGFPEKVCSKIQRKRLLHYPSTLANQIAQYGFLKKRRKFYKKIIKMDTALENLKYNELRKIAKQVGIKANHMKVRSILSWLICAKA